MNKEQQIQVLLDLVRLHKVRVSEAHWSVAHSTTFLSDKELEIVKKELFRLLELPA